MLPLMSNTVGEPQGSSRALSATAALVFANMAALFAGILVILDRYEAESSSDALLPQDIWGPFLLVMWLLGAANGLLLLPWRATRRIGLGILAGTVASVIAYYLWIFLVVLPGLGSQLGY